MILWFRMLILQCWHEISRSRVRSGPEERARKLMENGQMTEGLPSSFRVRRDVYASSVIIKNHNCFSSNTKPHSHKKLLTLTWLLSPLLIWHCDWATRGRQAEHPKSPLSLVKLPIHRSFPYFRIFCCYLDLTAVTSLDLPIWLRSSGPPRNAIPISFSLSSNCRFTEDPLFYSRISCCQFPSASINGGYLPYLPPYIVRFKDMLHGWKFFAGALR